MVMLVNIKKINLYKNPTDFLCITPESLEVILMNRNDDDKKNIFSNIKFVLIDEIHYFADSDRWNSIKFNFK